MEFERAKWRRRDEQVVKLVVIMDEIIYRDNALRISLSFRPC